MPATERVTRRLGPHATGARTPPGYAHQTLAPRLNRRRGGEATANGWTAEPTSCQMPGSVNSSFCSPAAGGRALDHQYLEPAAASVTAAASPVWAAADHERVSVARHGSGA